MQRTVEGPAEPILAGAIKPPGTHPGLSPLSSAETCSFVIPSPETTWPRWLGQLCLRTGWSAAEWFFRLPSSQQLTPSGLCVGSSQRFSVGQSQLLPLRADSLPDALPLPPKQPAFARCLQPRAEIAGNSTILKRYTILRRTTAVVAAAFASGRYRDTGNTSPLSCAFDGKSASFRKGVDPFKLPFPSADW